VRLIFVRRQLCHLRRIRRRVARPRKPRSHQGKFRLSRKAKPTSSFKLLGGSVYLPKDGKTLEPAGRKYLSLRAGFLKRPPDLVGQPVRLTKKSRKEHRSSAEFALVYASLTIALRLPRGIGEFPDNYCLGKSSTSNWYFITRKPSLRAARRIVMMALDDPGVVMNILPYTIRELSSQTPRFLEMIHPVCGESFPKPGMKCCHARRYEGFSVLEQYRSHSFRLSEVGESTPRLPRVNACAYGAKLFCKIRDTSPQIKSVTKGLSKRQQVISPARARDVLRSPIMGIKSGSTASLPDLNIIRRFFMNPP